MAIWRPTDDTPLTPLRTPFGLMADSVEADLTAAGFTRYATKADMDANTTAADGTHATVYADGTPANNGDYVAKSGVWSSNVGPWLAAVLASGITTTSGRRAPRYRIDRGLVQLEGCIDGSSGSTYNLFTLPSGYQPSGTVQLWASAGSYIQILADGTVTSTITGTKTAVSFSGQFGL